MSSPPICSKYMALYKCVSIDSLIWFDLIWLTHCSDVDGHQHTYKRRKRYKRKRAYSVCWVLDAAEPVSTDWQHPWSARRQRLEHPAACHHLQSASSSVNAHRAGWSRPQCRCVYVAATSCLQARPRGDRSDATGRRSASWHCPPSLLSSRTSPEAGGRWPQAGEVPVPGGAARAGASGRLRHPEWPARGTTGATDSSCLAWRHQERLPRSRGVQVPSQALSAHPCRLPTWTGKPHLWVRAGNLCYVDAVMLTRPTVSRPKPRPRPEVLKAKAKASHSKTKSKVKASHFKHKIKVVYLNTTA